MIIKSLSRKSASFGQLFDYMNRATLKGDALTWNLHGQNRSQILEDFYQNASQLRSHALGNSLYHEILSLKHCPSVSLERQQKALYDLANKYLSSRGKDLLGYGRIHIEKGHLHMHVMLSANSLNSSKRHRLTKAEFQKIQQQCELYIQQAYPDLAQPSVYAKEPKKQAEQVPEQRTQPETKTPESSTHQDKPRSKRRKELEDIYSYYQQVDAELDGPEQ